MKYFNYTAIAIIIIAASWFGVVYTFNHINPWLSYGIAALGVIGLVNLGYYIFKHKSKKQ